MAHLRHLAALTLALAVAMVLTAAPAHAGQQATTDATHDVYHIPGDAQGGQLHLQRDDKAHDIVRAGTVYRGRTLTLWVQVRRLARTDYIANWEVKTPHARWAVHYDREVGPAYTSLFHFGGPEVLDCQGLRGKALPRRERVVVTVPRACIGSPRWIRFGASVGHQAPHAFYLDDARIDAGFDSSHAKLGPRVRHN
jgi:hypothetical protein